MPAMSDTERKNVDEIGLDHAWKWFEYHATQRMTMIRFYLIAAGGIAAGTGVLLTTSHEDLLACLLATLGGMTSLAFKRLDNRVSDLVEIGENALKPLQKNVSIALDAPSFEICRLAEHRPEGNNLYSYG